ncbi:hypothetical protein Tco_1193874 [Tanacetum coccineum]
MQQPIPNPEDITDPTAAMNMALVLMAKIAQLGMNLGQDNQIKMVRGNGGNQFRKYAGQNVGNQVVQNSVQNLGVQNVGNQNGVIVVPGIANQNRNGNIVAARGEADLDEIEEVNANCILMANLQQASTLSTQRDKAPVYDSDGSAENDSNVTSAVSSVEQGGGTVEHNPANVEETHMLKSDFNICEDELLDKQIQLENKIKELDNIFVKIGQSIQTMHMLSSKPDLFYHTEHKMALGYQNPFYLKQAQQKQHSLYNGKVLLEKHDPPTVYDSEETLELALEKADESLAKHKALELDIECLLSAVISQDIMSIVQNPTVVETSDLQTKLDRTKERLENCIFKKEKEYDKLWNDWYKKCGKCKYDKLSYDKAYNDMQQKIERLQAQLGDQKGKNKDTLCVSNTLDPLSQKLENENVELEFQIKNYAKENAHLKTAYKNLFDSVNVT